MSQQLTQHLPNIKIKKSAIALTIHMIPYHSMLIEFSNEIGKAMKKTLTGLRSMLQGFQKYFS